MISLCNFKIEYVLIGAYSFYWIYLLISILYLCFT